MSSNTRGGTHMTKLYNFQVRLPFVFDADIQLTRQVRKGVPFMEAWRSNHDSVEVGLGSVWAVISADKTPMISAVAALGWITLGGLSVQSVATLLA
ncbi:hypothetical protein [Microvirga calopogonii]|uniref:hypothetical protein n=1 Tax=Microvirga calopogonii TaxID=2078013 RepID=UPI0013B40766|nr:hypothetical protein [Microvirga calopogonii]